MAKYEKKLELGGGGAEWGVQVMLGMFLSGGGGGWRLLTYLLK